MNVELRQTAQKQIEGGATRAGGRAGGGQADVCVFPFLCVIRCARWMHIGHLSRSFA